MSFFQNSTLNKYLKAQALKGEINRVDAENYQMLYQLYGLNEEEIKIVEGE